MRYRRIAKRSPDAVSDIDDFRGVDGILFEAVHDGGEILSDHPREINSEYAAYQRILIAAHVEADAGDAVFRKPMRKVFAEVRIRARLIHRIIDLFGNKNGNRRIAHLSGKREDAVNLRRIAGGNFRFLILVRAFGVHFHVTFRKGKRSQSIIVIAHKRRFIRSGLSRKKCDSSRHILAGNRASFFKADGFPAYFRKRLLQRIRAVFLSLSIGKQGGKFLPVSAADGFADLLGKLLQKSIAKLGNALFFRLGRRDHSRDSRRIRVLCFLCAASRNKHQGKQRCE